MLELRLSAFVILHAFSRTTIVLLDIVSTPSPGRTSEGRFNKLKSFSQTWSQPKLRHTTNFC